MFESILLNPKTKTTRKLEKKDNCVTLYELMEDGTWEPLSINDNGSEITAQAFLKYLMLWHKDMGWDRKA